jgi:pimeloyl-ACP methyl ester carboxylesterase
MIGLISTSRPEVVHNSTTIHLANVNGPIVLMGHSVAGIYMRDYASRYPADIAGIVFVDAQTPLADEHPAMKALSSKDPPLWVSLLLMRAPFIVGVPRLMGQCSQAPPGFTGQAGRLEAEDFCHMQFSAMAAERYSLNQSGHETAHTGPYGELPKRLWGEI